MKAIMVGTIGGENRLYYVIDSNDSNSDGVIDYGSKTSVVNFWKTVVNSVDVEPLKSTNFHKYLWDGLSNEEKDRWTRIFINKTESIPKEMLNGVTINTDVMKSNIKKKYIDSRVMEFKSLLITQNEHIVRRKTHE